MNILLVKPRVPDTFFGCRNALKLIRKKAISPPLGLLTVAALLPAEWNKRLVDEDVEPLTDVDLLWADYVFITGMIIQRASARAVIRRSKEAGVKVVAGGLLFMVEHERFPDVDHFVLNEAEVTLPMFLTDFARGKARRIYASRDFADMRESPAPLWELVDMKRYALMDMQFSRGCPFDCEFCNATALFGRRHRFKTSAQVIAELDSLRDLGWRGEVFFVDDNFTASPEHLKTDLLPALIEWQKDKMNVPFHIQACITLADDDELVRMMVKAGVNQVFIGIETPDDETLAKSGKNQNRKRDMVANVKRIQHAGLSVMGGLVVGFDSDTPAIFQQHIDLVEEMGIVLVIVSVLLAPPGTRLYKRLEQAGRLIDNAECDGADGSTNIIPLMDPVTLRDGYKKILRHIHSPANYYRRIKAFLRYYTPPVVTAPVTFGMLLTVIPISVRLGILGKERGQYWKLLLWALFHRPRLLPTAIMFAVCGYHHRTHCEHYFTGP